MRRLAKETQRPVTYGFVQHDVAPDDWKRLLDLAGEAADDDVPLRPQVSGRPIGLLLGLQTFHPAATAARATPRSRACRSTSSSARLPRPGGARPASSANSRRWRCPRTSRWASTASSSSATRRTTSPRPTRASPHARRVRASIPARCSTTCCSQRDGHELLVRPLLGYSDFTLEPLREMLEHPASVLGIGDGGAHVRAICDASNPTFMLTHWVRDRTRGPRLPLEMVIHKMTGNNAALVRARRPRHDRGGQEGRPQRDRPRTAPAPQSRVRPRPPGRRRSPGPGRDRLPGHDRERRDHPPRRPRHRRPSRQARAVGLMTDLAARDHRVEHARERGAPGESIATCRPTSPRSRRSGSGRTCGRSRARSTTSPSRATTSNTAPAPTPCSIVRGDDGELRAFQNVCRHRGNSICQGAGEGLTQIRCPWHKWTWDLQRPVARGAVASVVRRPRQRRVPALPRERRLVGAHRVGEPRPRRAAAARLPRGHPRRHRVGRPRRVPVRGGHAHHGRLQLEGDRRRLRRDVPRAGHPSRDARFDGRHQHEATSLGAPRRVVPAVRRAQPAPRARQLATKWCGTRSSRPRAAAWGPTTCTGARLRPFPRARRCST